MKRDAVIADRGIKGMVICLAVLLFNPAMLVAQDAADLPPGEGRDLVAEQCSACHALSTVLIKGGSRAEWRETVDRMINTYMAAIDDDDSRVIVDYLATHFDTDSSYDPGRQLVADQCFRCHGDGMWRDLKTDRTGWVSVIYRMLGRGGAWTPEQINLMADYLAETYPAGSNR